MKTKSLILTALFSVIFGANVFSQTTKSLEQAIEDCVEEIMKHHQCIDECTETMHVFKDGLTLDCPGIDAAFACLNEELKEIEKSIQGIDLDKLMKEINKELEEVHKVLQEMNDCLSE
ncbi:MAG: hypothetical protein ACLGGV_04545 [Bacteroidia bacterium]